MLPASGSFISPQLDFRLTPNELTSPAIISTAPPPSHFDKCNAQSCPWWPYSSSQEFKTNTALILTILFFALILALAFHAGIRYILRHRSHLHRRREADQDIEAATTEQQKGASLGNLQKLESIPTLIFSPGTKLKGTEAECTICLAEFVEGDVIRVLDRCCHGFHVQCIQQWLASNSSCPTCRASCFASHAFSSSSTNHNCQIPAQGS